MPDANGPSGIGDVHARPAHVRGRGILPLLVLVLLPFALFWPLTIVRETFLVHDIYLQFVPNHILVANLLRAGEWPLWNPYILGGLPLLGDGSVGMFYPPNWLFNVAPPAAAYNWVVLLHFSIAGAGMYLCARHFGLRPASGGIAALAFMFSGMTTARNVQLPVLCGLALLPSLVLCVDRALGVGRTDAAPRARRADLRWFVAAVLILAGISITGHPHAPAYDAILIALLGLTRAVEAYVNTRRAAAALAPLRRLVGIFLLGLGLAAIQLVPWAELMAMSPRAAGASFDYVMSGSNSGTDWLLFLFPYLYGSQHVGPFSPRPASIESAVHSWEHIAYVGLPTIALALAGLCAFAVRLVSGRQNRRLPAGGPACAASSTHELFTQRFLGIALVLSLVIAAGSATPAGHLIYLVPVLGKLRQPSRALCIAAFVLPMLAGFGHQWLARNLPASRRVRALAVGAGFLVLATTAFWVWVAGRSDMRRALIGNLAISHARGWWPLALAFCSFALLAWWAARPGARMPGRALVGLLLIDMAAFSTAYTPTGAATVYDRKPGVLKVFGESDGPFRAVTVLRTTNDLPVRESQETMVGSWGMVYGVEIINGFNMLEPRRLVDYLAGPAQRDISYGFLRNPALLGPDNPVLPSLNVRYVLVPTREQDVEPELGRHLKLVYENDSVRMYENTRVWPRAYFAASVRGETQSVRVLRSVTGPGFDGRRESWVESPDPPRLPVPKGPAEVRITERRSSRLTLATRTMEPRFLVLSEMYFPGWRAEIDGVATRIERTNYLFRGVVVPAGIHTVTFAYRPASGVIGAALSGFCALVLAGLWIAGGRVSAASTSHSLRRADSR